MTILQAGRICVCILIAGVVSCEHHTSDPQFVLQRGERVSQTMQPADWGESLDGVSTALTASSTQVRAGQPLLVQLWIRNESAQNLEIEHDGFWPSHRLLVTDQTGRAAERTPQGERAAEAFLRPHKRKQFTRVLEPHTVYDGFEPVDLLGHFHLVPGQGYRVVCESQIGSLRLTSNAIEIGVRPAD